MVRKRGAELKLKHRELFFVDLAVPTRCFSFPWEPQSRTGTGSYPERSKKATWAFILGTLGRVPFDLLCVGGTVWRGRGYGSHLSSLLEGFAGGIGQSTLMDPQSLHFAHENLKPAFKL